jgi:hypothetical protein
MAVIPSWQQQISVVAAVVLHDGLTPREMIGDGSCSDQLR